MHAPSNYHSAEPNTLDSVLAYSVRGNIKPLRFVALGKDPTSAAEAEDNEPTGVYVSAGGSHISDLLGTHESLFNVRTFFTMQHGENILYEIIQKF